MIGFAIDLVFVLALCVGFGLNLAGALRAALEVEERHDRRAPLNGSYVRLTLSLAGAAFMAYTLVQLAVSRAVWP